MREPQALEGKKVSMWTDPPVRKCLTARGRPRQHVFRADRVGDLVDAGGQLLAQGEANGRQGDKGTKEHHRRL